MEVDDGGAEKVNPEEDSATKSVKPSKKLNDNDDKTKDNKNKQLCRESYHITPTTEHKVVPKKDDEYRNFSSYSLSSSSVARAHVAATKTQLID
ncbi:unnamed protein product [Peronospora belbahrii]|nr:unnamed protein product [Peronospora belbahrii]CAH0477886.1 unnamed protein product [Peronospora belbahrii]